MAGFQKMTSQALRKSWMSISRKSMFVPKAAENQGNPWMSDSRKTYAVPKAAESQGNPWMSNSRKTYAVPKAAENRGNPWMSNYKKPSAVPKPSSKAAKPQLASNTKQPQRSFSISSTTSVCSDSSPALFCASRSRRIASACPLPSEATCINSSSASS